MSVISQLYCVNNIIMCIDYLFMMLETGLWGLFQQFRFFVHLGRYYLPPVLLSDEYTGYTAIQLYLSVRKVAYDDYLQLPVE